MTVQGDRLKQILPTSSPPPPPGVGRICTGDPTKGEELELELRARVVEEVGRGQLVTPAKKGLPANKGKQTDSREASLCFPPATE